MESREITFLHNDDASEYCGQYCVAMLLPIVSKAVVEEIKTGSGISDARALCKLLEDRAVACSVIPDREELQCWLDTLEGPVIVPLVPADKKYRNGPGGVRHYANMGKYHRAVLCRIGDKRYMLNPTYDRELETGPMMNRVVHIGKKEHQCLGFRCFAFKNEAQQDRVILAPKVMGGKWWESVGVHIKVTGIAHLS